MKAESVFWRPSLLERELEVVFDDYKIEVQGRTLTPRPTIVEADTDFCEVYCECHIEELNENIPNPSTDLEGYWDYAVITLAKPMDVETLSVDMPRCKSTLRHILVLCDEMKADRGADSGFATIYPEEISGDEELRQRVRMCRDFPGGAREVGVMKRRSLRLKSRDSGRESRDSAPGMSQLLKSQIGGGAQSRITQRPLQHCL